MLLVDGVFFPSTLNMSSQCIWSLLFLMRGQLLKLISFPKHDKSFLYCYFYCSLFAFDFQKFDNGVFSFFFILIFFFCIWNFIDLSISLILLSAYICCWAPLVNFSFQRFNWSVSVCFLSIFSEYLYSLLRPCSHNLVL